MTEEGKKVVEAALQEARNQRSVEAKDINHAEERLAQAIDRRDERERQITQLSADLGVDPQLLDRPPCHFIKKFADYYAAMGAKGEPQTFESPADAPASSSATSGMATFIPRAGFWPETPERLQESLPGRHATESRVWKTGDIIKAIETSPLTLRSRQSASRRPDAAISALVSRVPCPLATGVEVNGYDLATTLEYLMILESRFKQIEEAASLLRSAIKE